MGPARHPARIHESAVLEAFPTAFLAVLPSDSEIDAKKKQFGRKKSDGYWELAIQQSSLLRLVQAMAPGRRLENDLDSITNHDHRAAFIRALAALCLSRNMYVSAGDREGGSIVLPPRDHWWVDKASQKQWAKQALESNVGLVNDRRGSCTNHEIEVFSNGIKVLL